MNRADRKFIKKPQYLLQVESCPLRLGSSLLSLTDREPLFRVTDLHAHYVHLVYAMSRGQRKVLEPSNWWYRQVDTCGGWELNLDLLEELLTSDPSFQPLSTKSIISTAPQAGGAAECKILGSISASPSPKQSVCIIISQVSVYRQKVFLF